MECPECHQHVTRVRFSWRILVSLLPLLAGLGTFALDIHPGISLGCLFVGFLASGVLYEVWVPLVKATYQGPAKPPGHPPRNQTDSLYAFGFSTKTICPAGCGPPPGFSFEIANACASLTGMGDRTVKVAVPSGFTSNTPPSIGIGCF